MTKQRPFNFAPGPATLPDSVLKRCQAELLDYQNAGISILELGHRSQHFEELLFSIETKLRNIINVPNNYRILFLPGGARMQFASIPMNLLGKNNQADYIITGHWSDVAFNEAKKYGDIVCAATSKAENYFTIPDIDTWKINSTAAYRYFCSNETLSGVQFQHFFNMDDVPLVVDMTSDFLSRPLNIEQFGIVFGSTQKTMGIAGLCVLLIRDDLLAQKQTTPAVIDFAIQAEQHSLYNTPNVFAIYMLGLMLDWLIEQGGVSAIAQLNQCKASKLYNLIDNSNFYSNNIDKAYRSLMNVSFNLPTRELEQQFLIAAEKHNLINLEGHKVTGGARASLYNTITEQAVDALVDFMQYFQKYA
jgi:phosphoserine aminotransferase